MNAQTRQAIKRRLVALAKGPTGLFYHLKFHGDFIYVHFQPWGSPMVINWEQAESFLSTLPEAQVPRKGVQKEVGRQRAAKAI